MPRTSPEAEAERLAARLLAALSELHRAEDAAVVQRRAAERLERLHATTAALSAAVTPGDVAAVVAEHAVAAAPGAVGAAVAFLAEGAAELELAACRGECAGAGEPGRRVPLGADAPVARAVRERRALLVPLDSASRGGRARAVAALPIAVGDRALGAIAVALAGPALEGEEGADLVAIAAQGAQALDRARLFESERAARVEAQRAVEAARHAIELQERLVGVVGHDLRTPLAAVQMAVTLLRRHPDLTEEQSRTLERLAASAARMHGLVRDLLDFTRVRSGGGIPLRRAAADLCEISRRTVAELRDVHPGRTIALDADGEAPLVADAERIAQVVSNLCANAVQHGAPGTPVEVVVRSAPDEVALAVHNVGPYLSPDLVEALFEPFRQGPAAHDATGSVGLGLFVVREVVRAHGGDVQVRSAPGEGTTFTVRLPSAAAALRDAGVGA